MKIGIITYHFPYNSGAALQCTALQTVLEKMGHEVCVINYRPWYHQNGYTPKKNAAYVFRDTYAANASENIVKRLYRALLLGAKAVAFNSVKKKSGPFQVMENKFAPFVKRHLKETRVYRTLDELRQAPPDCDVIFSGSDQLWNTELTHGTFDPAYFITFAPEGCKRATYAVGVNFADTVTNRLQIQELVRALDAISLREDKYMRIIKRASDNRIPLHQDLDPTLLLDAREYAPFEAEPCQRQKQPYIVTYTMGDKSQGQVYATAKKLGEMLNIPVIDMTGNATRGNRVFGVESIKVGPDEFLSYIKHAAYVVTNSFHGTAFSVTYRKQFVVIPHTKTGNRVTDLLNRVGLSSRWCSSQEEAIKLIQMPVDFTGVTENIAALREQSMNYIASVCAGDYVV